jgi:Rod binding domain-containing protein
MEINLAPTAALKPLHPGLATEADKVASAQELKKAFTDFVGKTFYGQMLKAMRSTVNEPAYFSGGRTEEVFRSQLDQQLADSMSDATATTFAEPMFRHQFPRQAELLANAEKERQGSGLADLASLRRR